MKQQAKIFGVAVIVGTAALSATAAQAWWGPGWGGPGYGNGWNDFLGDGYGDGDFNLNMSGGGRGWGRGYKRYRDWYGYGPYGWGAPYGYAPYGYAVPYAAPAAPVAPASGEAK